MTDGPHHDYPWYYLNEEDALEMFGTRNCTERDIGSSAPNSCYYAPFPNPGDAGDGDLLQGAGIPGFAPNDTKLSPARVFSEMNRWRNEAFDYLSTQKTLDGYPSTRFLPPLWNITHPSVWPVYSRYAPQHRHYMVYEPPANSIPHPDASAPTTTDVFIQFEVTIDISSDLVGYSETLSRSRRDQVNYKTESQVESEESDDGDADTGTTTQAATPTVILSKSSCGVLKPESTPESLEPTAEYTVAVFTATLCNYNNLDETYDVTLSCMDTSSDLPMPVSPDAIHRNISLSSRPNSGLPQCATLHSPPVTVAKNYETGQLTIITETGRQLNASLCTATIKDADSDTLFIPIHTDAEYSIDNWSFLRDNDILNNIDRQNEIR
ncbi:hypothetical protein KDA14_05880, partial [Candidatus Saccharibacteria bacterium]|nr:hypothetical protein [Candidatus Saccharibacteria bacterium]